MWCIILQGWFSKRKLIRKDFRSKIRIFFFFINLWLQFWFTDQFDALRHLKGIYFSNSYKIGIKLMLVLRWNINVNGDLALLLCLNKIRMTFKGYIFTVYRTYYWFQGVPNTIIWLTESARIPHEFKRIRCVKYTFDDRVIIFIDCKYRHSTLNNS